MIHGGNPDLTGFDDCQLAKLIVHANVSYQGLAKEELARRLRLQYLRDIRAFCRTHNNGDVEDLFNGFYERVLSRLRLWLERKTIPFQRLTLRCLWNEKQHRVRDDRRFRTGFADSPSEEQRRHRTASLRPHIDPHESSELSDKDSDTDSFDLMAVPDREREQLLDPLDRERFHITLGNAIRGLPIRCRRVFVLRHLRKMTYAAISKEVGVGETSVKKDEAIGLKLVQQAFIRAGFGVITLAAIIEQLHQTALAGATSSGGLVVTAGIENVLVPTTAKSIVIAKSGTTIVAAKAAAAVAIVSATFISATYMQGLAAGDGAVAVPAPAVPVIPASVSLPNPVPIASVPLIAQMVEDRSESVHPNAEEPAEETVHPELPGGFPWNPLPGQVHKIDINNKTTMEFAYCPKTNTSQGFWMGRTEVTQAQWNATATDTGLTANPSLHRGDSLPVEEITVVDAEGFCKLFTESTGVPVRLPNLTEWNHAAAAGRELPLEWRRQRYSYPRPQDILDVAWFQDNNGSSTSAVGTRKPNAWNLYDLFGNVFEFVRKDTGELRVIGGSWDSKSFLCKEGHDCGWKEGDKNSGTGFRVVFSPDDKKEVRVY